jgi:hypothetical protein
MDEFIARQNIIRYRRELECGADGARRSTLLQLLVGELGNLGLTHLQLVRLDHHIARLSELLARQVASIDEFRLRGEPVEQQETALASLNDMMVIYLTHRRKIAAALRL